MDQIFLFSLFFIIGIFIGIFAFFLPLRYRKMNKKIVEYYGGIENYLLGDISLTYKSIKFNISGVASGHLSINGSYTKLWTYVAKHSDKFILGNSKSGKYLSGSFLVLPPNEIVSFGSMQILIGAETQLKIDKLKSALNTAVITRAFTVLFNKEFSHLTVSSEIHFSNFRFKKRTVLKYVSLPEGIYTNPEDLKIYLDSINDICLILGLPINTEG